MTERMMTMTTKIFDFTSADLASGVRAVARDYPTYKYEAAQADMCAYFNPGTTKDTYAASCIVGHALHRLGVTYGDIEEYNLSTQINELLDVFMLPENRDAVSDKFLLSVQNNQDLGMAWGRCVEIADVYR
jgi:hypothetical protein